MAVVYITLDALVLFAIIVVSGSPPQSSCEAGSLRGRSPEVPYLINQKRESSERDNFSCCFRNSKCGSPFLSTGLYPIRSADMSSVCVLCGLHRVIRGQSVDELMVRINSCFHWLLIDDDREFHFRFVDQMFAQI